MNIFILITFKLSQFVIPFDYEQLTHTKRRKYFEPHLYNPWGKVMLDYHLATLYAVETRLLKQSVRRNKDRFPEDFMFQLGQMT